MPILLPVFHVQLEAHPIPDGISPEAVSVIMLAKFSMGGIVQIYHNLGNNISPGECLVHHAVACKWEMLFPWMQFFLPPSQRPPSSHMMASLLALTRPSGSLCIHFQFCQFANVSG